MKYESFILIVVVLAFITLFGWGVTGLVDNAGKDDRLIRAMAEGQKAYDLEVPPQANPYTYHVYRHAWLNGWMDAAEEDK